MNKKNKIFISIIKPSTKIVIISLIIYFKYYKYLILTKIFMIYLYNNKLLYKIIIKNWKKMKKFFLIKNKI